MRTLIMAGTVVPRDAIGNDIAELHRRLAATHDCRIHGDTVELPGVQPADRAAAREILADPDALIFYHHSIHWPDGERLLEDARARLVVRYHNVTPAHFFEPYTPRFTRGCAAGREQTARLATRHPEALWLADSTFNLSEAGLLERPRTAVTPPFNIIETWRRTRPDEATLRALLEAPMPQLLFVSRVAPNKGHRFLFEVLADYRDRYGEPVRLHMVGKRDPELAAYNDELDRTAEVLGIESCVHWTGPLNDEVLLAYYLGCDFYVSCSEHEGFCLPAVEAQSLHLPVIARRAGAMVETLTEDTLLLGDDPSEYSAALRVLTDRREFRDELVEKGIANYESRFTNDLIAARLGAMVESHLGIVL